MDAPRALRVELGALARGERPTRIAFEAEPWSTLASWGGSALGLACLLEHARRAPRGPQPFVLAVGDAVRAQLPTAARAAVLTRAPLSGLYAEGHVGGELGARLAGVADALVLEGRCALPGGVLVVDEGGECALLSRPALRGAAPAEAARALEQELGPCAVLAIGPGGEQGLPFASLAVGHSPPSFVGRGGLGAAFGALGLKALCVRARAAPAQPRTGSETRVAGSAALVERLRASPRLAARAAGGTLELFEAWQARGELAPELARSLASEARERADRRHGCRGCPTPCGWEFQRSDGARQGARFGASQALGVALGLESLDDTLALLAVCDRLGIDAKEVGAILSLRNAADERAGRESARGRRDELARRIAELVSAELGVSPRAHGRAGAAALARELDLLAETPISRGQAVRPEASRAALLGQCVASGGADPMRSFPFLLESASRERLAEMLAPLPIPEEALDPHSGRAKGRLVFWHENLISAVDLAGFCAFSAAGLLSDGLATLDELATWILPAALREPAQAAWAERAPGERLLAAGASLALARRALNALYGMEADVDRPPFARAALEEPGMLDEYFALRGLDPHGRPRVEAQARLGTPELLEVGSATLDARDEERCGPAAPGASPALPRERGRVTLRASGGLALVLGERREVELDLPATVSAALFACAAADGAARAGLFSGENLIPAVWRAGRRLAPADRIASGDVLELVTAIGGG